MTDGVISGKDDGDMVADTGVGFIAKHFFIFWKQSAKITLRI